jgi:hypothetical protein
LQHALHDLDVENERLQSDLSAAIARGDERAAECRVLSEQVNSARAELAATQEDLAGKTDMLTRVMNFLQQARELIFIFYVKHSRDLRLFLTHFVCIQRPDSAQVANSTYHGDEDSANQRSSNLADSTLSALEEQMAASRRERNALAASLQTKTADLAASNAKVAQLDLLLQDSTQEHAARVEGA